MPDYQYTLLQEFDPNEKKFIPWATYLPSRRMKFKTHSTRAVALNCMGNCDYAVLYENVGGRWVERARKCPEDHNGICDQCGGSTIISSGPTYARASRYLGNNQLDTGQFCWKRYRGKIVSPPEIVFVCRNCAPLFQ